MNSVEGITRFWFKVWNKSLTCFPIAQVLQWDSFIPELSKEILFSLANLIKTSLVGFPSLLCYRLPPELGASKANMNLFPTLPTLEEIGYNDVPVLRHLRNSILVTLSLTQKPEESNSNVEELSWQNCLIDDKFFLIEGTKIFLSTNDLFRVCKEVSPIWVVGNLFPFPTKTFSCPTYGVEHVRLQQSCYLKLQSLDIRVSHQVHVHLWLWRSEDCCWQQRNG